MLLAAAVLVTLPVPAFYALVQRKLTLGLSEGANKGENPTTKTQRESNRDESAAIARIVQDELAPLLVGEDATRIEYLWRKMAGDHWLEPGPQTGQGSHRLRRYRLVGPVRQGLRGQRVHPAGRQPHQHAHHLHRRLLRSRQDACRPVAGNGMAARCRHGRLRR